MTSDNNDDIGELENFEGAEEIEGVPPPDDAEAALSAPSRDSASSGSGGKRKLVIVGSLVVLLALCGGGYYFFMMGDSDAPVAASAPPSDVAAAPPSVTPEASTQPENPLTASDPNSFASATPPPAPADGATPSPGPGEMATITSPPSGIEPPAAEGAPAATAEATPSPSIESTPATPEESSTAPATVQASPASPDALGAPPAEEATAVPVEQAGTPAGAEMAAAPKPAADAGDEPPADLPMPVMTTESPPTEMPLQPPLTPAAAAAAAAASPMPETAAAPSGAPPAATGKPSSAEMAIVQNAAVLDQLSQPVTPGSRPFDPNQPPPNPANALNTVDQLLEESAIVRPMPPEWLTVRKVRDAGDVDSRLTAARSALAQNNDSAALELFSELEKSYPKDKRILMGRAVSLQKLGQYDAALSAYESVLNSDPKNLEALTNMLGLLKTKDPKLALDKLQELRDTYPYQPDITAQLGIAYGTAGQYENALKYLDMAEALKPGSSYVLYNKAVVYDKMGRSHEAGDLYRQVVRMAAEGSLDQSLPLDAIRRRLAVLR